MLLKLIKTQEFISGAHCEVWEVNSILGDRLLAKVFVLKEHLQLELIYRLTVSRRGICIHGKDCAWQWEESEEEVSVTQYLTQIQAAREEIRIEICSPIPDLPGYPEVDYHPVDFPIVLLDDLSDEVKPEEPTYESDFE